MKFKVNRTVSDEVEVDLPIYGSWFTDVDDGRLSWETQFCINEKLEFRTVSQYSGDGREWEMSVDKLTPDAVGIYLKYPREDGSEFREWVERACRRMGE